MESGPEVIKELSCSTQLSTNKYKIARNSENFQVQISLERHFS